MIDSHPSLSTISGQLSGISGRFERAFQVVRDCRKNGQKRNPAQKRRFIKPNKTGDPNPLESSPVIGNTPLDCVAVAIAKCRESCLRETKEKRILMSALCALILLGIAALAAVLLVAVGIDRDAKAIKRQRGEED